MPAKLYKMDASPPARAAMLACEIFNVPTEFIDVNLGTGEHLTPEFLKINPCHTVPVFVDGDLVIHDSHAILMYVADTYGNNSALYPKDVKQRALVNQKLFFNNSILFQRLRNVTYPMFMEGATTMTKKQADDIEDAYKKLEVFLNSTRYLAGDNITIADVAAYTNVGSLVYLHSLDASRFPKLNAWKTEMENKPYCQKVNNPGQEGLGAFIQQTLKK